MKNQFILKILYLLISLLVFNNVQATLIESNIPDIGQRSNLELSKEKEKQMGQDLMQQLYASDEVSEDPVVNEYLEQLSKQLTEAAPKLDFKLHLFAINSPELNAFTFFGGHIAVHTGLIKGLDHESELAGVLAHETAHIAQRHLARAFTKNKQLTPLTYAELLAAIAIGALGAPEAGSHLATAALGGHVQQMINFTRDNECEADRIAIQILAKAGFDTHGLPDALKILARRLRYHQLPPEYLLTHPIHDTRIADCLNRIDRLEQRQTPDSLYFSLIRARIETDAVFNTKGLVKEYKNRLESHRYSNKIATEYAYALALAKNKQYAEALQLFQRLSEENVDNWIIDLTQVEVKMMQNAGQRTNQENKAEVLLQLETLMAKNPDNFSIIYRYAEFLVSDKQSSKAEQVLLKQHKRFPENPQILSLLAKVYSQLKRPMLVHETQAEWHFARGEFKEASHQLDIALEHVSSNHNFESNRILSRKEAIKAYAERQKKMGV